jgi:hypothetical protein
MVVEGRNGNLWPECAAAKLVGLAALFPYPNKSEKRGDSQSPRRS